ncbi:DUF6894 family protein [Methylobacterium sp. CM6257]
MARYRFHCTDGLECVFDAVGDDIRTPERLSHRAEQVAQNVMRSLDGGEDWSKWHVSAHSLSGRRVLVQPFTAHAGELNQAA